MSLASQVIAIMYGLRPAEHSLKKTKNIDVKSVDGISLQTDVYFPRIKGSFPTVLLRTPYGRRGFAFVAKIYAERGYIAVLQAVRGTDGSSGEFSPLINERTDGLATLDWIKQQDWFDGRIALVGPSYLGYCALSIIDALPKNSAVSIKATSANFESIVFPNGAFHMQLWLSWMQTIFGLQKQLLGMTLRIISGDVERKTNEVGAILPLVNADLEAVGHEVPFWREWMNDAIGNHEFWEKRNHTHRLNANTPPTSFVTGWYDLMMEGHLADYQRLVAAGQQPQLTIGNWHHTDNEMQGENLRQSFEWLDFHMLGDKQALRKSPVRIFISGSDQWHDLDYFPPISKIQSFHLNDCQTLTPQKSTSKIENTFIYDPANPTPSVGGSMFAFVGAGAQDNMHLEARDDVLTYSSESFIISTTILGVPTLQIHVKSSLKHADFFARICDVDPEGKSTNISDGIIRLTPKNWQDTVGDAQTVEIKLGNCGHTFLAGHKIRLQISGGAHPRFARNLGTDEPIATATKMKSSQRSVIIGDIQSKTTGKDFASVLNLPIWEA